MMPQIFQFNNGTVQFYLDGMTCLLTLDGRWHGISDSIYHIRKALGHYDFEDEEGFGENPTHEEV